jgi:hypothetical protein
MATTHTLPEPCFGSGALEPALEELDEPRREWDSTRLGPLERSFAFKLSGHILHSIFWSNIAPNGGGEPDGELAPAILRDFGSFAHFKRQLTEVASAIMGAGWGLLIWQPAGKRRVTTPIYDHLNPRKSFEGLSSEVRAAIGRVAPCGHTLLFLDRRQTQATLLVWTQGSYAIVHKGLDLALFTRPHRMSTDGTEAHEPTLLVTCETAQPRFAKCETGPRHTFSDSHAEADRGRGKCPLLADAELGATRMGLASAIPWSAGNLHLG